MKTKVNVMKKVLGFVLTLVMVSSMLPMTSNAAETVITVSLNPGDWNVDNAWFAAYCFGNGEQWYKMTYDEGSGAYKADISTEYTSIIFCRMDKDKETLEWGSKWNQTGDLSIPTNVECCTYTIDDAWNSSGLTNADWSHAYTDNEDSICDTCGLYKDGFITVKGYSLSLDDNIGVNFHVELDSTVANDASAKMHITLPNGTTEDILVSSAPKDTNNYYIFKGEVAAKEMTEQIKAQLITDSGNSMVYTYAVRNYAESLLSDGNKTEKEKALVNAMLNYGAASQTYFGHNTTDLANKNGTSTTIGTYDYSNLESFAATITDDNSILEEVKANLVLESKTILNVKFNAANDATIELNDVEVTATGTNYVIPVKNINPANLATNCKVDIIVGGNTATIQCCPLSYCYSVLKNSNDANLKNVVCALYDYNKAAVDYITQ